MKIRELLIATILIACGPPRGGSMTAPPPPAEPAPTEAATPTEPAPAQTPTQSQPAPPPIAAEGTTCLKNEDCASGVCEGQGCDDAHPGTCAPKTRGCTRDLRAYCGCDGKTFSTSGSCPGRRYAAKGACTASAL
ncbi:MAG TPA: hypothetical protein VIV40_34825 [Kofleriaceae bacterium]